MITTSMKRASFICYAAVLFGYFNYLLGQEKTFLDSLKKQPVYFYKPQWASMSHIGPEINLDKVKDKKNVTRLIVYGGIIGQNKKESIIDTISLTPEQFPELKELKVIGQVSNLLSFVSQFKSLVVLDISQICNSEVCLLSSNLIFPDDFFNLKNLRYLNISSNRQLLLPEDFGRLTNLEVLSVIPIKEIHSERCSPSFIIPISLAKSKNFKCIITDNYHDYIESLILKKSNPKIRTVISSTIGRSFGYWLYNQDKFTNNDKAEVNEDDIKITGTINSENLNGKIEVYYKEKWVETREYKNAIPSKKWAQYNNQRKKKLEFSNGQLTKVKGGGIFYDKYKMKRNPKGSTIKYTRGFLGSDKIIYIYDIYGSLIAIYPRLKQDLRYNSPSILD